MHLFPGGKAAGTWCWIPTPSCSVVKERVEVYVYSPTGPSWPVMGWTVPLPLPRAFFLGGRRGTCTPKHFVNLMGENKNFKMLDFPLNKLQIFVHWLLLFFFLPIWTIKLWFSWVKLRVPLIIYFLGKKNALPLRLCVCLVTFCWLPYFLLMLSCNT
jgi:hypothetical protein